MNFKLSFNEIMVDHMLEFKSENENLLKTIENLGARLITTNKMEWTKTKRFPTFIDDWESSVEIDVINIEFIYEIDELEKIQTFINLILSLDYQLEYELLN